MSLKNRYNLWNLKQDFAPGKVFKVGLERSLSQAWNAKYGRPNWFQIGLLHKGATFAVVVLLLIGSTGAYAYVSPEVTEGTAFYPLKQAVESVEEVIKITPEAKAKFYLKQIKRREAEKAGLIRKNIIQASANAGAVVKVLDKEDVKINVAATASAPVKKENKTVAEKIGRKNKVNPVEIRIEKTQRSIERTEERLEKAKKIMEKRINKFKELKEKKGR